MASTNNNEIDSSRKETYLKQLAKLECPFTWNIDIIDESIKTEYIECPHEEENPLPLQKLMKIVLIVYQNMKDDGKDHKDALNNLEKCDQNYKILKDCDDVNISTKVARAVLQATKCFVYFKLNMEEDLELTLTNLENMDSLSNIEKSTLLACKSICYSRYRRHGSSESERLIREAISLNDNCDLWHFILGKMLRRQRRDISLSGVPDREEENSFLKAYSISKNPIYGIFVAQMYREGKYHRKAVEMYEDIFESFDSLSNTVLLRLALGFINLKKFEKAKACLDKAEEGCSKRSMYMHYRGMYHFRQREYKEAIPFYKEAIKENNLPAERQCLECLVKSDKNFNTSKYLEDMVNKWRSKLPDKQMQPLILDVAFSYWKDENKVKAVENFLDALKIDPGARCLMNSYRNYALYVEVRNVYDFLKNTMLRAIDQQFFYFNEAIRKKVDAIREYCKSYDKARMNTIKNNLTHLDLKK